jgi:uncharacterized protein
MKTVQIAALALTIVGALNWGLVGLFNVDLVKALFGPTVLSSIVYVLVGISGVFLLVRLATQPKATLT